MNFIRASMLKRFGFATALHTSSSTLGARLGILLYGTPFVGGFIRSLYFKKYINKLTFNNVLDAGCGWGDYAVYLAARFPGKTIDACDKDGIEHCISLREKTGIKNINFFRQDLNNLDISNRYDLIYCIDALEHIVQKEDILRRFHRALRKKGSLYIHMPQKEWFTINFFSPARFTKFNEFIAEEHPGKQFDLEEFSGLLERNGFRVIIKQMTFGFFGKLAWELDQVIQHNGRGYIKAAMLPFIKLLGFFDVFSQKRNGCGFLVLAQKIDA